MPNRFVGHDRSRRIAFSKAGSTIVLVNQDNVSDVYIFQTEEEGLNIPFSSAGVPQLNGATFGTKLAANGGQLNWTEYKGELWAIASGGVGANGTLDTFIRVLPG